ncbi:MAG: transglutaminase-like domain-containing protein [Rikenellaceae bacterium]|nr:transglutaminase-like domain-containing protein [Rikenellaceae bacterium]
MKNLICTLFLACSAVCFLSGQNRQLPEFFEQELNRLYGIDPDGGEENLRRLVEGYGELATRFYAQPDDIREENRYVEGHIFYNLACYQSMLGMKREALLSLGIATDRGWTDYRHALQDSDLDNIRSEPLFDELVENIREKGDYIRILQNAGPYDRQVSDTLPTFTYLPADAEELLRVREYFQLDTVAGQGDEISRIKNIMSWLHNLIRHDGSSENPAKRNAIDIYTVCMDEGRGVSCRMLAQVLNECYLAMGFKSRYVTCLPEKHDDPDCHVINAVYSETLGKWIWMDPSFNAWVTDDDGNLLGLMEVRERLIAGLPMEINPEANWNNENPTEKEWYIDSYMAKNLYYMVCPVRSEYDTDTRAEGKVRTEYVDLLPIGYTSFYKGNYTTHNPEYFWQAPL